MSKSDLAKRLSEKYNEALLESAKNNAYALAEALMKAALRGEIQALKEINERILGKVRSEVVVTDMDVLNELPEERFEEIIAERLKKRKETNE